MARRWEGEAEARCGEEGELKFTGNGELVQNEETTAAVVLHSAITARCRWRRMGGFVVGRHATARAERGADYKARISPRRAAQQLCRRRTPKIIILAIKKT